VGSCVGTTLALSFLVARLLGVVEEGGGRRRGVVEFPTTGLLLWGGRHWPW